MPLAGTALVAGTWGGSGSDKGSGVISRATTGTEVFVKEEVGAAGAVEAEVDAEASAVHVDVMAGVKAGVDSEYVSNTKGLTVGLVGDGGKDSDGARGNVTAAGQCLALVSWRM